MSYEFIQSSLSWKQDRKIRQYVGTLISRYKLNLAGKTVFTEYASGNYYYTAVAAKLAGANRVYAYYPFGERDEMLKEGIIKTSDRGFISEADIVTNSGNVRPITCQDICSMKSEAVIALMMMKSQVRKGDVDFYCAKKSKIRVVGTDEERIGILDSIPFKIMKVCFEADLSVWKDKFFLISDGKIQRIIKNFFEKSDIHINIEDIDVFYDAVVVSDYSKKRLSNEISKIIEKLYSINPLIQVIWISGALDESFCVRNGIAVYPLWRKWVTNGEKTNVSGDYLSYKVVTELNVASLAAASQI